MTDQHLLLFGSAITFITLSGFYVYLRREFTFVDESGAGKPEQIRETPPRKRAA